MLPICQVQSKGCVSQLSAPARWWCAQSNHLNIHYSITSHYPNYWCSPPSEAKDRSRELSQHLLHEIKISFDLNHHRYPRFVSKMYSWDLCNLMTLGCQDTRHLVQTPCVPEDCTCFIIAGGCTAGVNLFFSFQVPLFVAPGAKQLL